MSNVKLKKCTMKYTFVKNFEKNIRGIVEIYL